jgi:hypothetical protein
MPSKIPPIFRLKDALTFGLGALLVTCMMIAAHFYGRQPPGGMAIGWAVAGGAWLIYAALIIQRWQKQSGITFLTDYGTAVHACGFPVLKTAVEAEIRETILAWHTRIPEWRGRPQQIVRDLIIVFHDQPFRLWNRTLNGAYDPDTRTVHVGFKTPLSTSALSHELGHAFYHVITGKPLGYEGFAAKRGVP